VFCVELGINILYKAASMHYSCIQVALFCTAVHGLYDLVTVQFSRHMHNYAPPPRRPGSVGSADGAHCVGVKGGRPGWAAALGTCSPATPRRYKSSPCQPGTPGTPLAAVQQPGLPCTPAWYARHTSGSSAAGPSLHTRRRPGIRPARPGILASAVSRADLHHGRPVSSGPGVCAFMSLCLSGYFMW